MATWGERNCELNLRTRVLSTESRAFYPLRVHAPHNKWPRYLQLPGAVVVVLGARVAVEVGRRLVCVVHLLGVLGCVVVGHRVPKRRSSVILIGPSPWRNNVIERLR